MKKVSLTESIKYQMSWNPPELSFGQRELTISEAFLMIAEVAKKVSVSCEELEMCLGGLTSMDVSKASEALRKVLSKIKN